MGNVCSQFPYLKKLYRGYDSLLLIQKHVLDAKPISVQPQVHRFPWRLHAPFITSRIYSSHPQAHPSAVKPPQAFPAVPRPLSGKLPAIQVSSTWLCGTGAHGAPLTHPSLRLTDGLMDFQEVWLSQVQELTLPTQIAPNGCTLYFQPALGEGKRQGLTTRHREAVTVLNQHDQKQHCWPERASLRSCHSGWELKDQRLSNENSKRKETSGRQAGRPAWRSERLG